LSVGPVPTSHPLATIPASDPLAAFLTTPPIVLVDNTLILNPAIFSHLTAAQLSELQALGTRKTLEILGGYIKGYIKEMKKGKSGKTKGKPKKAKTAVPGSTALPGSKAQDPNASAGQEGATPVKDVSIPVHGVDGRARSPIIVVDDGDMDALVNVVDDDEPAAKRRKLDDVNAMSITVA
jgi:hypothetical protein